VVALPGGRLSEVSELLAWFERTGRVTVAFSGGVDSALVLAAATRALGAANVHAVTAVSASLPTGMLQAASRLAAELRVRHSQVRTGEMDVPGYQANGADRCYFCKATLVDAVAAIEDAGAEGLLVTGTNADDVRGGWRPGIRAAAERGAGTPLADTGLGKQQVREISRRWRLPTWDRPASPCLSSRVAYGVRITPARLARVDRAELSARAALAAAGIAVRDLRVRDLGDAVRLEVDDAQVEQVRQDGSIEAAVLRAGFGDVRCEVTAFRTGSLNAALPAALRYT